MFAVDGWNNPHGLNYQPDTGGTVHYHSIYTMLWLQFENDFATEPTQYMLIVLWPIIATNAEEYM